MWNIPRQYTLEEWQQMEEAGAVFLPATGIRTQNAVDVPRQAVYWSSTGDRQNVQGILISACELVIGSNTHPYFGGAVRLVQDVNAVTTRTEDGSSVVQPAEKVVKNGTVYILHNGNLYTVLAVRVK